MPKNLEHILCVDDEEDILEVASMALESVGGFRVTRCVGGAAGIAQARKEKPDLILIDVMMPGMDGPTTLSKIRADPALDGVVVIFMTARIQPEDVEKYLEHGAAGVIQKPFDPMTLSEQVAKIWRQIQ